MTEPTQNPSVRLEDDDVPMRTIVLLLVATVGATLISIALARGLFGAHENRWHSEPEAPLTPPKEMFHGLIAVERTGQRDAVLAEARLTQFGWVDRERRLVHIPIERAMDLELAALTSATAPQGGGR